MLLFECATAALNTRLGCFPKNDFAAMIKFHQPARAPAQARQRCFIMVRKFWAGAPLLDRDRLY